ncbi:Beta-lactamase [Nonlabens sp. Hel1_33_55]|uniref:serine hydrolase domain-containing protein n=1 Tax=Nonlabens sp. Hel1_33_55 TaxID=1336802 RepID=UPI000875BC72|nr:serine hydrolase domain-containing protein [Nonlabens sp. Hel1_33_55]SCY23571.1 Beta-lactamase [Nonlabens sp. Hel1_33_55]
MTAKKTSRSKRIFQVILLTGTAISLYFVPWPIVFAWIKPLPATVQEQMDLAADYGFDGIIVYVDQKGKPSRHYTSGYKNTENKIPADPQSFFKIASVSKLYHAVSVARLAHQGKLSLDKSLAFYLPQLKGRIENADDITIRMMVQHRSGIPNYTDVENYWAQPKENEEGNLALILDKPADFDPDKDYAYSNTNYLLLHMIIRKVVGYEVFQYMKEEILDPLNLNDTYGSVQDVDMDRVMSGYYVGYEGDLKNDDVGMLATAQDLGKFIRALNEGTVFTDKEEQEIYSSIYVYDHTGLVPGYQTIAKYHKDIDAVVIQFTNTVDFEGYNWSMSEVMYSRIVDIIKK